MADTSGEKKKETLEEKFKRQKGESSKTAAAIGEKNADIDKKRADIKARRTQVEKMIAELEEAEATVESVARERDDLKIQKGIQDAKAMLTGKLLGIKKAFTPMVQGFKDRIENIKQVTSDMKDHQGIIDSKTSDELGRAEKGYMRQSKAAIIEINVPEE